uniref:Uncharacterized protein n=1 Tax=Arundo donax TaxID=35708 RepID=A0A0A9GCW8_ARUDO
MLITQCLHRNQMSSRMYEMCPKTLAYGFSARLLYKIFLSDSSHLKSHQVFCYLVSCPLDAGCDAYSGIRCCIWSW